MLIVIYEAEQWQPHESLTERGVDIDGKQKRQDQTQKIIQRISQACAAIEARGSKERHHLPGECEEQLIWSSGEVYLGDALRPSDGMNLRNSKNTWKSSAVVWR
jgi:hypothetical protein